MRNLATSGLAAWLLIGVQIASAASWTPIARLLNDGTACTAATQLQTRWNDTAKQVEICYNGTWSASGGGGSTIRGSFSMIYFPAAACAYVNPFTGGCTCDPGYTATISSFNQSSGWSYVSYLCVR